MARRQTGSTLTATRSLLYRLARLLGDISAVQRGRVGQRIARRIVGRAAGRLIGRLFR
jgi:hypothetical protein